MQLLFIILGSLFACVFTFFVLILIADNKKIANKYKLLEKNYQGQAQMIQQMMQSSDEISRMRHNNKNMLIVIEKMAIEGQNSDILEYMRQVSEGINKYQSFVNSGNKVIDSVINFKIAEANAKDIRINYLIDKELKEVESWYLTVVIGNLLDNAIEAEEKENKSDRFIQLVIKNYNGYLMIHVKNYISASVLKENPNLHTNKKDKKNHGFGVSSIRRVVEKRGGMIEYYEKASQFCCLILL